MSASPRLYLTGASCAGVSTLGAGLAARLGVPHLDTDAFFWRPTDPPFAEQRPVADRLRLIREAQGEGGWVLSGALETWGEAVIEAAGLIVFVTTPAPLRMERLDRRERARHGARILPGGDMHATHLAFRDWASRYDDPAFAGRSRARHEAWLAARPTPALRLDGARPLAELVDAVIDALGRTKTR